MPKVSVIVATHNNMDHLGECLDSILSRQMQEIEVIIVDVNSTDGTKDYIEDSREADNRIVFLADSLGSMGHAKNKALKYARAEYVVFVEPDDYICDDMLEYLYLQMESKPEDVLRLCRADGFGSAAEGKRLSDWEERTALANGKDGRQRQVESRLFRFMTFDCVAMYRKSLLLENDIWFFDEPGYGRQDTLFKFLAMSELKMSMTEEVFYCRRYEKLADPEADDKAIVDVNRELRILRNTLMKDQDKWWRLRLYYWQSYYDINMALYEKLDGGFKKKLAQRMQAELKTALRNKEFSSNHFDVACKDEMEQLLVSVDRFVSCQKRREEERNKRIIEEAYKERRHHEILARRDQDEWERQARENRARHDEDKLNRNELRREMARDMEALRILLGMSPDEMGSLLGISTTRYKSLESGKKEISWDQYMALIFVFRYNTRTQPVTDALGLYPKALKDLNRKGLLYVC